MQKDLDGYKSEYNAKTIATFFDLVDASGDPDVEIALAEAALDIDEMSLPANLRTALTSITGRTALRGFATALNSYVQSVPSGSYASFRAYLVDKSAKIHPLFCELFRAVVSETTFTSSSVVAGVSNPAYAAIFANRVYRGADGSLADELADSLSAATGDVTLFASDDHALYIGCDRTFQGVVVALSQLADVTIIPTFQYYNGNAWTTLTVTDSSVGFTKNSLISWTVPADWGRWYKDAGGTAFTDTNRLYYIRIARTENTVGQLPIGTCITLIPDVITRTATSTTHLGIPQPPLAICKITAASTMTVTLPTTVDYTRFAEPVGTESKLRARALTPIAQDLTITLSYTNSVPATGSTAQSAWTAPAALGTKTLALTSSDALRAVRTASTVATTATEGVFVIEAMPIRDPVV